VILPKRQEVTKLDEKECDESIEIRLRTALGARCSESSTLVSKALEAREMALPLQNRANPGTVRLPRCHVRLFQQGLDKKVTIASILVVLNHQRSDLVNAF